MTYSFTDHNSKRFENELSVDFVFKGDVTLDEAVSQIDKLVGLANNKNDLTFISYKPSMFMKTNLVE